MALLSAGKGTSESLTSSLNTVDVTWVVFIILSILFVVGAIYLFIKLLDLMDEKKKYYENMSKKLKSKEVEG